MHFTGWIVLPGAAGIVEYGLEVVPLCKDVALSSRDEETDSAGVGVPREELVYWAWEVR